MLTLYINARKEDSWSKDYDESFPYILEFALDNESADYCWTVGSIEVDVNVPKFTANEVVTEQIVGLEKSLERSTEAFINRKVSIQTKIADLMCLPAPEDVS